MVERKHSGSYEVNEKLPSQQTEAGWCGTRLMVYMTALACLIIYLIGAVITGVAYRTYSFSANCTHPGRFQATETLVFQTPLVVVGPCFMSAGGSILLYLLFQWFLCRPTLK